MTKYIYGAFGLILAGAMMLPSQERGSRTLHVNANYTGSGTVDSSHPIAVALWSSPSFTSESNAMPIAVKVAKTKDGSVTFSGVSASPVYVSAAYDPSGKWDGTSGPPPTGSSLGMYSKEPGKPEPVRIESGKAASVTFSFDDSFKMK